MLDTKLPRPLRPQLLARVAKGQQNMVAAGLRTIFAQPDAAPVDDAWGQVRDQLAERFPTLGPSLDEAKAEVLAFTAFPRAHWTKIWSTNTSSGPTRR